MAAIFSDDIFRYIFVNEKFCILIKISLKFVPYGPIGQNVDKPKRQQQNVDKPKHRQTKMSTNQNVDKWKFRQTETSTNQNADKPKRRQTETSTNHFSLLYAHIYIFVWI